MIRSLWNKEKKADWQEASEPKEWQSDEFQGFLFASCIPDLKLNNAAAQKYWQTDKTSPNETLLSLAKE